MGSIALKRVDIKDISGDTAEEQIELINEVTKKMVVTQYDCYKELKLEMKKQKVLIVSYDQLTQGEKKKADIFYRENIYPLVTPTVIVIDKNGSFLLIANKTINFWCWKKMEKPDMGMCKSLIKLIV